MAISERDRKNLTQDQLFKLQSATMQWEDAYDRGDEAGMKAAHDLAEGIRNSYGYSGGPTGIENNYYPPVPANVNDFGWANRDPNQTYHTASSDNKGGGGGGTQVQSVTLPQFPQIDLPNYSYDMSEINDLKGELSKLAALSLDTPKYQQGWGDEMWQKYLQDVMDMTYSKFTEGDQYGHLANRYRNMGRSAMDDVLGRISARTGGMASSYGSMAAGQQYNQYMQALEQVARDAYEHERGNLMQNALSAKDYGATDYSRWLNWVADKNRGEEAATGIMKDLVDYAYGDYDRDYSHYQDLYNSYLNAMQDLQEQYASMGLDTGGGGLSGGLSGGPIGPIDITPWGPSTPTNWEPGKPLPGQKYNTETPSGGKTKPKGNKPNTPTNWQVGKPLPGQSYNAQGSGSFTDYSVHSDNPYENPRINEVSQNYGGPAGTKLVDGMPMRDTDVTTGIKRGTIYRDKNGNYHKT